MYCTALLMSFSFCQDTALVQHHDGITGTAKPFVADDYTNRLNRAVDISHEVRVLLWHPRHTTRSVICVHLARALSASAL